MKTKICVIDNYDSFVYNLVHILEGLDADEVVVYKNDEVNLDDLARFDKILLSPGPGIPSESGKLMAVIERCHLSHNILGVCLGHQAIGEFFGWTLTQLEKPLHGIPTTAKITHPSLIFRDIPENFSIGHYHSWVVEPSKNIPQHDLIITAVDQNQQVMAFMHSHLPIYGVQFHPESILTDTGRLMLKNWLEG